MEARRRAERMEAGMKNIRIPLIGVVPSKVPVIRLPKPIGAASTPLRPLPPPSRRLP